MRATPGGPRRLRPWRASDSCPRVSAAVSPFTKTQAHRAASANFFNTSSKWEALEMFLCGLWEAQLVALAVPVYRWLACLFKLCTTTATTTLWNSAPLPLHSFFCSLHPCWNPIPGGHSACCQPNRAGLATRALWKTFSANFFCHWFRRRRDTVRVYRGPVGQQRLGKAKALCFYPLFSSSHSVLLPSALWSWASRWTSAPAARCQTRGKRLARLCFARC